MNGVLDDDVLAALLADAAATAPAPEEIAPRLLLDEIDEPIADDDDGKRQFRRAARRWLPAAAAILMALAIGSRVLDDPASGPDASTGQSGSASGTSAGGGGNGTATFAPMVPLQGASPGGTGATATGGGAAAGGVAATAGAASGPSAVAATAEPTAPATQLTAPRVVKNGSVEIQVAKGGFEPTVDRVTALATGAGGYVSATETTELGAHPRGSVTVRVPAAAFEQLLTDVRRLGEVKALATSGNDVTAQYTDLEARLQALTATRDQLLTVLGQAESVPDILAVQDRINGVNVEIESLEGQRRLLDDQATYGTLAVTVAEPGSTAAAPAEVTAPDDGGLSGAWEEAKRGFGNTIEWFVARSGKAAVLSVVALVLVALAYWALRRTRRLTL